MYLVSCTTLSRWSSFQRTLSCLLPGGNPLSREPSSRGNLLSCVIPRKSPLQCHPVETFSPASARGDLHPVESISPVSARGNQPVGGPPPRGEHRLREPPCPARGASVRDSPERFRDPVSRLRVQRYGNFSIPASLSPTFFAATPKFFTFP